MQNKLNLEEHKILLLSLEKLYKSKINFDNIEYKDSIKLDYLNSSINRYIKIIEMFNEINLSKINTIFTVLKLQRNKNIMNYAFIYGIIEDNKVINKFLITSNTLVSKDGMYSHRLINFDKIQYKSKLINDICNFLKQNLKFKEYKLLYEYFNLYDENIKKSYSSILSDSNLLIKIYAITWLIELYNMYRKNQEINMNDSYNNIMFTEKDKQFFITLYKNHKKEIYDLVIFYKFLTHDDKNRLEIGQKIIPFNYIQLKEYNNIVHYQWKEILINKIVTNLLYNINAPTFSIFIDWIFINNSNRNLYDNKEIYDKILYSDKIKNILQLLNQANNEFSEIYNKKKNEFIDSLIKKLKKIIKLSENKVLMSNISLCYLSEYSGKTIYDYFNKINDKTLIHKNIGDLYTNYELFKKYMFEIIYGLYCLNLKGIIHGDLHLNNVTLNKKNLNTEENSYVIYNLNIVKHKDIINVINSYSNNNVDNIDNTENYTFILPHLGTHPCIIDFSRSFILLKLISENIIEKEKNNIRTKFIKMEQQRIMTELKKIFPNFLKNNAHKIKFLFKNKNFNILFIYFSAFDIFKFSSNLLIFINKFSIQNDIIANPEILQLLDNISKKAYSYLEKIIDEESYVNSEDIKFPNLEILLEFFSSFKVDSTKSVKNKINKHAITDIFSIDNIESYLNINDIINEINLNLSENLNLHTNKKTLDIINNKIKSFINYTHVNDDLEIEYLINKEYYKIKNNLSFITTNNFTSGTVSESDFSIYNF
jgi:hypothetical protein